MSERLQALAERIESVQAIESQDGAACYRVGREHFLDWMRALRDEAGFETVTLVTAIDRLPHKARFELNYMLLSLAHRERVRVCVELEEEDANIPTITGLWPGANYFERECYDMFGICFAGHPKLERLLMPEGYGHHPLRKDFPHHGIEPDRLYREWERTRFEAKS